MDPRDTHAARGSGGPAAPDVPLESPPSADLDALEPVTAVAGRTAPAILLVQGWDAPHDEDADHLMALAGLGVTASTFQLRGLAATEDEHDTTTRRDGLADLLAAYDQLAARRESAGEPIGVVGFSYGGYLAVLLTLQRPVRWLALRSPALYPDAEWDAPKVDLDSLFDMDAFRAQALGPRDNRVLAAAAAYTGDVLLVEAGEDTVVGRQVGRNFAGALDGGAAHFEHEVIDGADHGLSDQAARAAYDRILLRWLGERIQACTAR